MNRPSHTNRRPWPVEETLLVCGAALLAIEPTRWLVGTWVQDGYDGFGAVPAALSATLFAWAGSSPLIAPAIPTRRGPWFLLLLTALLRLASQWLAIDVLGALLLGVDVFAAARIARLDQRTRAIAPGWLAILFCFSLPLEPMLQRVLGYPLQELSTGLACAALSPFFEDLVCEAVRLRINDVDVQVDLPCSGAELLFTIALVFALMNTLKRPTFTAAAAASVACLGLALGVNALRISVLAVGLVYGDWLPFSVMAPLPHTVIGVLAVGLASAALYALLRALPATPTGGSNRGAARPRRQARATRVARLSAAAGFVTVAAGMSAIQPQPVDATLPLPAPELPLAAGGYVADAAPLTPLEHAYFKRYGGSAARASYGPFGLLLVSTGSPLRHLHDPTICLTGNGYHVELLGTDHQTATTVYRAHRPGQPQHAYLVRVSYIASDGALATSVGEVVWRWLHNPASRWTMVQRLTPEAAAFARDSDARTWDTAVRRAFNLS